MPRHEIIALRIPAAFQGESARLPPPTAKPLAATRTVAEYRAYNSAMRHECPSCGVSFDMSSLEPVFDAWGPDAVITVSLSHYWVPGEPRLEPGEMRERARANRKRRAEERGRPPSPPSESDGT